MQLCGEFELGTIHRTGSSRWCKQKNGTAVSTLGQQNEVKNGFAECVRTENVKIYLHQPIGCRWTVSVSLPGSARVETYDIESDRAFGVNSVKSTACFLGLACVVTTPHCVSGVHGQGSEDPARRRGSSEAYKSACICVFDSDCKGHNAASHELPTMCKPVAASAKFSPRISIKLDQRVQTSLTVNLRFLISPGQKGRNQPRLQQPSQSVQNG